MAAVTAMAACALRGVAAAACLLLAGAAAAQAPAATPAAAGAASYVERPIYSEPGAGLQMPPGCRVEPSWRTRLVKADLEVWVVACDERTHVWLLRRSIVEVLPGNQARLRFVVTDDLHWPQESPGDSASVQCTPRDADESGFVVLGAKWRAAGAQLRLASATAVLRADPASQKFVAARLAQVDCVRHPEREALMRRLQQR